VLDEGLGHEKRPLEIDVQHRVIVRFGDIPEVRAPFEAGVVHQDIHASESGYRVGDKFLAIGYFADVHCMAATLRPIFCRTETTWSAPALFER
jgi:hypothetical protein